VNLYIVSSGRSRSEGLKLLVGSVKAAGSPSRGPQALLARYWLKLWLCQHSHDSILEDESGVAVSLWSRVTISSFLILAGSIYYVELSETFSALLGRIENLSFTCRFRPLPYFSDNQCLRNLQNRGLQSCEVVVILSAVGHISHAPADFNVPN
jgi:hypothetical protein